jgi:hypothetical protein
MMPLALLAAALAAPACAQAAAPSTATVQESSDLEGRIISRVTVTGNRTRLSVLEPRILLKEGLPFHRSDLVHTMRNLHAMRLFKKVEIEPRLNGSGGVDVEIRAEDGWYIVPIPFLFGGGGGSGAALTLSERNYFGSNESLFAAGSFNDEGSGERLGGSYDRWSGNVGYSQKTFTQYAYSNGSFNTDNFLESSRNLKDPSRYGVVVSSFDKRVEGGSVMAQYALSPHWRAGLGFTDSFVGYSQETGPVPNDAGRQNWAEARLNWTGLVLGGRGAGEWGVPSPWSVSGGAMGEMIGSIFGLGLADVGERIRPLPEPRLRLGAGAAADLGTAALGSDFDFTRYTLEGSAQWEFVQRHTLTLRVVGTQGFGLPFSQEIPTNGALGLRGNYVREFIGTQGVGTSLGGNYLLHQSRRGVLSVDAFVESATVQGGAAGGGGTLNGVGGGLHYTFWRFPLPLGLGYSYSLTDRNGQVSFAAGGRFGG